MALHTVQQTPATITPGYRMSQDCFLARVRNSLVILDVKSDEYVLIEARHTRSFLDLLCSDPPSVGIAGGEECDDLPSMIRSLEERSVIVRNNECGVASPFLESFSASLEVPGPRIGAVQTVRVSSVVRVVRALVSAYFILKFCSLSSTVSYVRKIRCKSRTRLRADVSVCDIVEQYNRIKPFFLASKDNCLLNSLSMILYLSKFGIVPYWCFGVALRPFSAHCWVEDEEWLYNDQFQRTHAYVPIMRA